MADLSFEWDPRKDTANQCKHGVLGLSAALRIFVVVHAYRERDEVIRIVSARKATRPERTQYEERWRG